MKSRVLFTWSVASLAIILLAAGFSACGGGGGGSAGGSGTIQLSGTVNGSTGTGYAVKAARFASANAASDPSVDQVVAIPMSNGSLSAWEMANSQTSAIQADGSFALSLAKTSDWLLVLIDSSVTGTGRFVGSVAMNTSTADSLLNLPATDSTLTTMSLGTVSRPTTTATDAVSTESVAAADFSMTTTQLATMAKTDNLFRNAMNIVNNYGTFGNAATTWYQLRPDFSFDGDFTTLTTAYSSPSLTYTGMNFQLDQNADTVTMTEVCDVAGTVSLHPPVSAGNVTIGTNTYSYANPIKNSGNGCSPFNGGPAVETDYNGIYAGDAYQHISFSVIDKFTSGVIPAGFWEWKEKGVLKAAFDISSINPPVTATGKIKGFVPSFKINADGTTGRILSVDIQWFYYDETSGTYTGPLAADDLKLLKHFIRGVEVKFDRTYNGLRRTDELYVDPSTTTNVVPTKEWYVTAHPADPSMETGLMGFYESGGFGYFFNFWNNNMTP